MKTDESMYDIDRLCIFWLAVIAVVVACAGFVWSVIKIVHLIAHGLGM